MRKQKHRARMGKVSRKIWADTLLCGIILSRSITLVAQQPKREKAPGQPDAARLTARHDYETRCSSCHGLDGRGGEHAPNISTNPAIMTLPDRDVIRMVHDGRPTKGMPAFDYISESQIRSIVSYLRTAGKEAGWDLVGGNPLQGETLFYGKAGCGNCHMVSGKGGFLGSDLTEYAATHGPGEAREAILRPGKLGGSNQKIVSLVTRKGEHLSGVIRNEDNFSLQLLGMDGAFHNLMKSEVEHMEPGGNPVMPADYGQRLTSGELDDLAGFLAEGAKSSRPKSTKMPRRGPAQVKPAKAATN